MPDILDHLTHSSNAIGFQDVVVPSSNWSGIIKIYWVWSNRRWCDCICGSIVFVEGDASAERANAREAGGNYAGAEIAEAIAHLIIRLLALRIRVEGPWCLDFNKENGMLVNLHGKHCDNVDCIAGGLGDVKLRDDFERTLNAKEMVQKSGVRPVVCVLIGGELRLVGRHERGCQPLRPRCCHVGIVCGDMLIEATLRMEKGKRKKGKVAGSSEQ